jgi:hypothetical protein
MITAAFWLLLLLPLLLLLLLPCPSSLADVA